ncbi:hypothetical protein MBLNU459_g8387t1 [Dothideomycetes sp. NU459]
MPPRRVTIDDETVYRSEPIERQKKFPGRKQNVRTRRSLPPNLRKAQSTLTQLDWSFTSTSSDVAEHEGAAEDIDDDDDEFEVQKPRKKRRKTMSDRKRQATLTQIDFGQANTSFLDDDPSDLGQPGCVNEDAEDCEDERVPESDCSPQIPRQDPITGKSPKRMPSPIQKARILDTVFSTSPASDVLSTPHKIRRIEIPSSNTPQSILLSTHSRRSFPSPQKSPLGERSMNLSTHEPSSNHSAILDSPIKLASPQTQQSMGKQPVFHVPSKPILVHKNTIPDSDDTTELTLSPRRPKRNTTIQDTQFDAFGPEITADTDLDGDEERDRIYGIDMSDGEDYDGFDPVCSALDRDAARFMQTQRLLDHQRAMRGDRYQDASESHAVRDNAAADDDDGDDEELPHSDTIDFAARSQELGDYEDEESLNQTSRTRRRRQHHRRPRTTIPNSSPLANSLPATPTTVKRASQAATAAIEVVDLTGVPGGEDTSFDLLPLAPEEDEDVEPGSPTPRQKAPHQRHHLSGPPILHDPSSPSSRDSGTTSNSNGIPSSPPALLLPAFAFAPGSGVASPSQVSTVDATQLSPSPHRRRQRFRHLDSQVGDGVLLKLQPHEGIEVGESSSPPRPPGCEGRRTRRWEEEYADDDDDDDDGDEPEEGALDLGRSRQFTDDAGADADADVARRSHKRFRTAREILPDTLLDFSLPPPPPSSGAWGRMA